MSIIARKLLQELKLSPKSSPIAQPLTEREVEVLRMVAQGKNNRQIADELVLSWEPCAPTWQHPWETAPGQPHPNHPVRIAGGPGFPG